MIALTQLEMEFVMATIYEDLNNEGAHANAFQENTASNKSIDCTIVMLDDNTNESFLTRRLIRKAGIVNRFVSERKAENLFTTLDELVSSGVKAGSLILLLDINMPKMNGFDVLAQLREHPRYHDVTVLMLSNSEDVCDMFNSYEYGAFSYLSKPFDAEEFMDAVRQAQNVKRKLVHYI